MIAPWILTLLLIMLICRQVDLSLAQCSLLYDFGPEVGDASFLEEGLFDDDYTDPLTTPSGDKFIFYGEARDEIYVSDNGEIWFDDTFSSNYLSAIAVFGQDHFTAYPDDALYAPYVYDRIYYRITNDVGLLKRAKKDVAPRFKGCGGSFEPTELLVVTWNSTRSYYYASEVDGACTAMAYAYYYYYDDDYPERYEVRVYDYWKCVTKGKRDLDTLQDGQLHNDDKKEQAELQRRASDDPEGIGLNTYQLVLATDGTDTYAIVNYDQVQWMRSYFSYAWVGFTDGPNRAYTHPFSGGPDLRMLETESNVGRPGRWIYKISENQIRGPNCEILQITNT